MDHRQRILDLLEGGVDELARKTATSVAAEVSGYGPVRDEELVAEMVFLSTNVLRLLVRVLRRETPPTSEELGFIRERAALRARQLIPLSALLHAKLIANHVVGQAIADAAGNDAPAIGVALALTAMTSEFTLLLTTATADAYLDTVQGDLADLERQRIELLDAILTPGIGGLPNLSRRALGLGLEPGLSHIAIVAQSNPSNHERTPETSQRWAARAISLYSGKPNRQPFVVVRGGEIVALLAQSRARVEEILKLASAALHDSHGEKLVAGIGPPFANIGELRLSYEEARRALRHTGSKRPFVVGPEQVRLFDELALSAEGSLDRLIPSGIRAALKDPSLRATLDALATSHDVSEAAKSLFIHPNSLRYRLRRIADRTGLDPRRTKDLLELTAIARVMDAQSNAAEIQHSAEQDPMVKRELHLTPADHLGTDESRASSIPHA